MIVKWSFVMVEFLSRAQQFFFGSFGMQVKQSFVPGQRRQPSRMPVIPLRGKRQLRRGVGHRVKDHFAHQVDEIKSIEFNWTVLLNTGLAAVLLLVGIGVVHFSYQNRQQVIELSELRSERDQAQQTWTYLLRDQNQLSEFSRIENTAMKSLQMHRPDKSDIYIMRKSVQSKSI